MNTIQKFTTSYVDLEDRMRLIARLEDSSTIGLWLNQRLLLRLTPHLNDWVDSNSELQSQAEISLEQPQHQNNEEAVECSAITPVMLVHSIDIGAHAGRLTLVFKAQPNKDVTLHFTLTALEQWLAILHKLWLVAEWPEHIWENSDATGIRHKTQSDSVVIH